jgi:DNA polymerase I-like protein with 3'-5' exonuclease and polymerase domains
MLRGIVPDEIQDHINFGSSQQLSILLFGGKFKWTTKVEDGLYKTGDKKGQIKYKNRSNVYDDPLFRITPRHDWKTDKPGIYSTSDEVLTALKNDDTLAWGITHFLGLLQDLRRLNKEISGYYEPLPKLMTDENIIHQNINNVATATGRLSQNQPNLQNVSGRGDSRLKEAFVSRWGDSGWIVEIDYSQLEVIGLAYSCKDPKLLADIRAGKDMHGETMKGVVHLLPSDLNDKEKRRLVKGINFGLLYGGGIKKLSKDSGLPESVIKKIKDSLYSTYPGIKIWQELNVTKVDKSKIRTYEKSKNGFPICKGTLKTDTGRVYTFKQYDAMPWQKARGIDVSFNRSQICNYPIQGFATGDIVPTVIGEVTHWLHNSEYSETCLMINTTHDSITFDIKTQPRFTYIVDSLLQIMEDAPTYLKEIYDIDFDLPLKCEATMGKSWKNQHLYPDYLKGKVSHT